MDIKIGSPVLVSDGEAGRVERIILHPETNELEGIVAAEGGLLTYDVVVPADMIEDADEDGVRVHATSTQIGELEPFSQSQYTEPPEDWLPPTDAPFAFYLFPRSPLAVGAFEPPTQPDPADGEVDSLEPGDIGLSSQTEVLSRDGVAGRLERVVTEEGSDQITHLIIKHGPLIGRLVAIPIQDVAQIGETVQLNLTNSELDHLPTFAD